MMRNAQQIRSKLLTVILAGVAGVGFATAATAAGVDIGVDANVDAGAQVEAPGNVQAGGPADAHMSPSGSTNTNAQWQSGAARGADRAAERMGTNGTELKQSTELEATGKRPQRLNARLRAEASSITLPPRGARVEG